MNSNIVLKQDFKSIRNGLTYMILKYSSLGLSTSLKSKDVSRTIEYLSTYGPNFIILNAMSIMIFHPFKARFADMSVMLTHLIILNTSQNPLQLASMQHCFNDTSTYELLASYLSSKMDANTPNIFIFWLQCLSINFKH